MKQRIVDWWDGLDGVCIAVLIATPFMVGGLVYCIVVTIRLAMQGYVIP